MRADVVIVGAGIGGAVLALELGKRGRRVAIVEREAAPPAIARPEILWGPTLQALQRHGVADAIRDTASTYVEKIEIGPARPWLTITQADLAAAGVDAFSTNPSMTRSIIAAAAAATGNVEIHRGVAVDDLLHDQGRVIGVRGTRADASFAIEADAVVGDDGGNSIIRRRLGIPIALDVFPVEFVTAHLRRWTVQPHHLRVWIAPEQLRTGLPAAGFIPWPENEGVLLVPLPSDRANAFFEQPSDLFWSALARVTPLAESAREQLEFPRDFKRVVRPFGHAASYVGDGAALIGDAVHPMTPAGGQGANASIWDALALADVIDAALASGDVSRARLLPYERLRRPVNTRSVSFSRTARRLFRLASFLPIAPVLPIAARTIEALGWPKRKVIRTFATAFVHERGESPAPRTLFFVA